VDDRFRRAGRLVATVAAAGALALAGGGCGSSDDRQGAEPAKATSEPKQEERRGYDGY
jgi:hypothetical protein